MPTYTWTRTREQIRDAILRKLGALGNGASAEPEDAEVVDEALQGRLLELHRLQLLWFRVDGAAVSLPLASGASSVSLAALDGFMYPATLMLDNGQWQREVQILGHREWHAIELKTQQGDPESAFVSGDSLLVHPVPNQDFTLQLTYQAAPGDLEQNTAPDVPREMMLALIDLVAGDLLDDFGVPAEKAARIERRQAAAMPRIRALNTQPVSTQTVQPEWF